MRKQILLTLLSVVFLMSCTETSLNTSPKDDNSLDMKNAVDYILGNRYIEMVDAQYILTLTKEEALRQNISEEAYSSICMEINKGNAMIRDIIKQHAETRSSNPIVIEDCTYYTDESETQSPLIKTRSEGSSENMPSGSLSTLGQEQVTTYFNAPSGMLAVKGHCYASFFAGHAVTTVTSGTTRVGSRVGSGMLQVSLVTSNTRCTLRYNTTDSNGGRYSWSGITKID